jgi:AraC-like DNA-binding protein
MESFFFNITDTSYKITKYNGYKRVDISNGVVFIQIHAHTQLHIKNLDRMIIIPVLQKGELLITDTITTKNFTTKNDHSYIYYSSKQNFKLDANGEVFILFIADFFLKRYLSSNKNEPIDFLYHKTQSDISFEIIDIKPTDALSVYIIDKIIKITQNMNSIRCEKNIMEFMIHRFEQLDIIDPIVDKEELEIAKKAKNILIKEYASAPTIRELSHLCATNESKLKKSFKKVYKITIYQYIKKRRLYVANLLLKDQILSIAEIAKKVGYRHQGHFSKLFFDHFGVYPKDLLK